jgi:uncharacterized protein YndB with AHSA1/START domain
MPTARASRIIAMPPQELWQVLSDPYHLPRWWPRVTGVELVEQGSFTEVMRTRKGKAVRADFDVVCADQQAGRLVWEQRLPGTPFAGVLDAAETELVLEPAEGGDGPEGASRVTIELRQEMARGSGIAPRGRRHVPSMGAWLMRRAASKMIGEALDGLERISG